MNYSQVLEEVKILAGVLKHRLGVKKGDRVILYVSDEFENGEARIKRLWC